MLHPVVPLIKHIKSQFKLSMSQEEEQVQEITIQDLEESLEIYELESEEKVRKLQELFTQKKTVDLSKMFYEERSSLQFKFQNILSDLTEFLVNQSIASTEKLRKTFYRLLENPMMLLFKVPRFDIFDLRLNAFDIELEPIEAVLELGESILANIQKYQQIISKLTTKGSGREYSSFEEFLEDAGRKLIQDQLFLFYSYLRRGGKLIKEKFNDVVKVADMYAKIEEKLLKSVIQRGDAKTLKQISVANYEVSQLDKKYDVLCFYLKVPLRAEFQQAFKELQALALKAKQICNYDMFILSFMRYPKEILKKLTQEGIDACYSSYIEHALNSLFELWGCQLCYYQQFFDLFQTLFKLHPNLAQILKICSKNNPDLKKDDIQMLKVNFKMDLKHKNADLLSQLTPKTMDEINKDLGILFHKTLYNLDFNNYKKEEIVELLTALNGNPSLNEFFSVAEKAFKEWNYTIDIVQTHKYIESQFKFPAFDNVKLDQSIRLFNNFCLLQEKKFSDYDILLKTGAVHKSLIGLTSFLFKNEKAHQYVKQGELVQTFLINALLFFKRTVTNNASWEPICLIYSSNLSILSVSNSRRIIQQVRSIIASKMEEMTIKNTVTIFQNIIQLENKQKQSSEDTLSSIIDVFMRGTAKVNQQIQKFKLFGQPVSELSKITASERDFMQKWAVNKEGVIEPKDNKCFALSQLEIITNPIQFDRVMDNYYLTLDSNAKKFIQFLASNWINTQRDSIVYNFTDTLILQKLIQSYPVSLPLLCSTRVTYNKITKRFVETLVDHLTEQSFKILKLIIDCNCIRYKNGRDYIQEEIAPLVLKATIKHINEGSKKIEHFELLALTLSKSKASDIKIDTVQKSIEAINFEINEAKSEDIVHRLSLANHQILKKFFEKKEIDMRKAGLKKLYQDLVWSETRRQSAILQTAENAKKLEKKPITESILQTPYSVSLEFDIEENKLVKVQPAVVQAASEQNIDISTVKLLFIAAAVQQVVQRQQNLKVIDLRGLKYNPEYHLGKEIRSICHREGFLLETNSSESIQVVENNDQNVTLVQFYIKEYQNPQISSSIVFKYVLSLINEKISISPLFSNYANLQKLFSALILLFNFVSKDVAAPQKSETIIDEILIASASQKPKIMKLLLKAFSDIGYTNLWTGSYNSLKDINYLKELREKTNFKEEQQEESFFSWILKNTLENADVKVQINDFLGKIFESRPKDQNSLMYKVTLSRGILHLIMKSLEIKNLSYVSLLFHSNFNNLRLYTDQLQEGLKALNIVSKIRAYNEYIQLSNDLEDEQFTIPMKLFRQNFSFFIRIQKEGYKFKKSEELKLSRERVLKALRSGATGETLLKQIEQIVVEFENQLEKLQFCIASRVRAFYLVTKLRDLSYQNSHTICLINEILSEKKKENAQIQKEIKKIEIFSLITQLNNELIRFNSYTHENFLLFDRPAAQKQASVCSIRRYSHSMSKVYEKCELQFDEVYQRCLDNLRIFFQSPVGKEWLIELPIFPPFLSKSFINFENSRELVKTIRQNINQQVKNEALIELADVKELSSLVESLRNTKKTKLISKDKVKIKYQNKSLSLSDFLTPLKDLMIKSETLTKSKDGYLLFNKLKTSEKSLEEIELLGYVVGYCIFNNIEMDLPLHSSLLAAISFGVCQLDDLIDIDFKVWQNVRNTLSANQCKDLNLNFSYKFDSPQSKEPERVQLIDKGASKKVNNVNREEYADFVCCYLLYKLVAKQISRFLEALIYVCPKELLASLQISQIHNLFIKKYSNYSKEILKRHLKKRSLILPISVFIKGRRVQNLKDYQSIQWITEILEENPQLKQKLWPNESNLYICTWMGQGIEIDLPSKTLLIGCYNNKQEIKQVLLKILLA